MSSKIQKNQILKKISYAKINLFLKVLNKRDDGFHNIFSLFHKIDLCDYLYFKQNNDFHSYSKNITVNCNVDLGIAEEQNIVYKTAAALNKFTNQNNTVIIEIDKKIPAGAGLGGGSSNAATTLLALNEFWNLKLEFNDLLCIAADLGSDVPFFLYEKPAIVEGRGEIITPIDFDCNCFYLLVFPNIHIDTKYAYSALNKNNYVNQEKINIFAKSDFTNEKKIINKQFSIEDISNYLYNDFEEVIFSENPELLLVKENLMDLSNKKALMTGSGSTIFAIFDNMDEAKIAEQKFNSNLNNLKEKFYIANEHTPLLNINSKNYQIFTGKLIK